ncbi:hypothetical protein EVJ50_04790 [Synechococcus sp. RSCCF101]|uniref:hypothetical protein n=1 Tax=Synechococcus sp. RSCCF101 TaxID=2511069 RepID=UPI001243CE28|nr:hypothetical protein [Synechococcus sp. RSCCF101]QEY31664.1 hypothetical protein EVJ50_04790 [Synechococcus sp. RSCCF101]
MLVYVCISAHGFGHGAREAAILAALHGLRPHWRLVVSTDLPDAFLDLVLAGLPHERRRCRWDVGVIQADALDSDPGATLSAIQDLGEHLPSQLAEEQLWLQQQNEPVLVVGDVAPAAADLARGLGAPLAWVANFGWDEIYADMGPALAGAASACRERYRQGQLLVRCPFSLSMPWQVPELPVGLTVPQPRRPAAEVLARLGWSEAPERNRLVIVAFGGIGLPLEGDLFRSWPEHRFLVAGGPAASGGGHADPAHVCRLPADLRPLDVMPLAGRLITKPGYSSFCEAMACGVGLVVVKRRRFAEVAALEKGLRRHAWHRELEPDELRSGSWRLNEPLLAPSAAPLAADGALAAAAALARCAERP